MNQDKLLIAKAMDRQRQCEDGYMLTCTDFLDIRQQALVKTQLRAEADAKLIFFGGYEEAERKVALFIPEYISVNSEEEALSYFRNNEEESPLACIRATHNGYKALSHRDYLGSILGLGIKRESVGDILVGEKGADIIIQAELKEFIVTNYEKAGRTYLSLDSVPLKHINIPVAKKERKNITVSSLRVDAVVAGIFGLSRAKSGEMIEAGLVFVNNVQCTKGEKTVSLGDKVVLRGRGKAVVAEQGGITKKNRHHIGIDIMP